MSFSYFHSWCGRVVANVLIVTAAISADGLAAEGKRASNSPAEELFKEALHSEVYGRLDERAKLLAAAVNADSEFAPARWQQGMIRHDGKWIDAESFPPLADSLRMKEYADRRGSAADTVEGQLQLANWCRDNALAAQEKAHLFRVLDHDPEHATVRSRLNYRMVSGKWVTSKEMNAANEQLRRELSAGTRHRTTLTAIRKDFLSGETHRQEQAADKLFQIKDVNAIPAMESMISLSCLEGALRVIDAVSTMKGQAAVDSLVRHALFSEWGRARTAAAEKLMARRRESYVPLMLAEMFLPLESQFVVNQLPDGRLGYRHAFLREGQEERQVLYLDTVYRRIRRQGGTGEETLMRAFLDARLGASQREAAAAVQNEMQSLYNDRIVEALNIATYQKLPKDPQAWWRWWDEQNDMVRLGDKQTRSRYELQQASMTDRTFVSSSASRSAECFAAGTKVWTIGGGQSIESIRIGDLVLAMDVESGQLAYKPVLRTTVRPAGKLVKVSIGRDTFETSNGHLFWVSGHGWAKAKSLDSGMLLHCLRGAQPLVEVDSGREAETFNLVVGDFHTYFVGEEKVLSHDVTLRRPTESVVPGFSGE